MHIRRGFTIIELLVVVSIIGLLLALLVLLALLAAAGVPGLAGFVAELLVFEGSWVAFPWPTLVCLGGSRRRLKCCWRWWTTRPKASFTTPKVANWWRPWP